MVRKEMNFDLQMARLKQNVSEHAEQRAAMSEEEITKEALQGAEKYWQEVYGDAVVDKENGLVTSARRFWQKLASYEETSPNKPKEKKKPPKRKLTREEWEEKLFERFQRKGPPGTTVVLPDLNRKKNWGWTVHQLLETDGAGVKWEFSCGCIYERRQKGKSVEDFFHSCSGSDCQNPNSVFYREK